MMYHADNVRDFVDLPELETSEIIENLKVMKYNWCTRYEWGDTYVETTLVLGEKIDTGFSREHTIFWSEQDKRVIWLKYQIQTCKTERIHEVVPIVVLCRRRDAHRKINILKERVLCYWIMPDEKRENVYGPQSRLIYYLCPMCDIPRARDELGVQGRNTKACRISPLVIRFFVTFFHADTVHWRDSSQHFLFEIGTWILCTRIRGRIQNAGIPCAIAMINQKNSTLGIRSITYHLTR